MNQKQKERYIEEVAQMSNFELSDTYDRLEDKPGYVIKSIILQIEMRERRQKLIINRGQYV